MAIQLIDNQGFRSKNEALLNDNSFASSHLCVLASKPAPTQPPSKGRSKVAFTLAEVLITLGIIGVVAALTLPTLIQNHRKSTVETKLKKFYTTTNQAILMAQKDYGDLSTWDVFVAQTFDKDDPSKMNNQSDKIKSVYDKYLIPYLNLAEVKEFTESGTETGSEAVVGGKNYMYYFSDGTAFKVSTYNTDNIFYYTENPEKCEKRTQSLGVCVFRFAFHPNNCGEMWKTTRNKGIEPYKFNWNGTDMSFLQDGCSSTGKYCSAVIQLNGWKIPDDYPFKL